MKQPSGEERCEVWRGFWHGDELGNMRKDGGSKGMQIVGGGGCVA